MQPRSKSAPQTISYSSNRKKKLLFNKKVFNLLFHYQLEARSLIIERMNSKHLTTFGSLIKTYSEQELEKQFACSFLKLPQGYTNSQNFFHLSNYSPIEGIEKQPHLSYLIHPHKQPSAVLYDLLYAPEHCTLLELMAPTIITFYYALLRTFQDFLGEEAGENLFNSLFNSLESQMLISPHTPFMGDRFHCLCINGITLPPNPLRYFIAAPENEEMSKGDISFYPNCSEYKVRHPFGDAYGYPVICVQDGSLKKFSSYRSDIKECSEEQLSQIAIKDYEKPNLQGTAGSYQGSLLPGFSKAAHICFDLKKVTAFLRAPKASAEKFFTFNRVEKVAIDTLRQQTAYYAKMKNTLWATLPITPDRVIAEDRLASLLESADASYQKGHAHYKKNALNKAKIHFGFALLYRRNIYHFYERHNQEAELRKADEQVAIACNNLAAVFMAEDKTSEALLLLEEAYEISKNIFGLGDEKTKMYQAHLNQAKEIKKEEAETSTLATTHFFQPGKAPATDAKILPYFNL